MKRTQLLLTLLAIIGLSITATAAERPNIILAMADDMGWQDLSCYGNDRVATPHIDRLAKEGMKLTQFYSASAVCTPTRVSVLTGKYPLRFSVTKHFNDRGPFLPACTTLPKLLKTGGYQTAHVGKWHLGGVRVADAEHRDQILGPAQHGFDHFLTQQEQQPLRGKMGRERTLFRQGGTCLFRNDSVVGKDDPHYDKYLTDIYGDESVRLIEAFHKKDQPFFLNLWWLTPHKPYEPAPEPHWSQTAANGISKDQHCFRSMMARMDYNFGKVLDAVDRLGIADNTIVLFLSDNGGAFEANNGELKGGKTDLHEGGIRVAGLARWPGQIKPGSESDLLTHSNDLLPTLCSAAGIKLPEDDAFDGIDILPLLTGKVDSPARGTTFWQLDLYKSMQRRDPKPKPYATEIARKGKWKLLAKGGEPVELYDIESDLTERQDLLLEHPAIVDELTKELKGWLAEPRRKFGNIAAVKKHAAAGKPIVAAKPAAAEKPKPNVVIFLADDMGWGDSATFGHPLIKTPNLDKLAAEGVKFTQCYSAAGVCSPSRSAILTGRTPYRNGVWRHLSGIHDAHLRASEITYPELLKEIGYETCHVGKWHLNSRHQFNVPEFPQPGDHGYDHWMTTHNNASPSHKNPDNFIRNGKAVGETKGYSAQLVAAEAARWLKDIRDPKKPFALSVWVHEPHSPIATDPAFQNLYDGHENAKYMGNITQLDKALGQVMDALDRAGAGDNTFLFFTSDNGPVANFGGTTGGLRGGKRSSHEGGIRVPGVARWPGHIEPGSTCTTPVIGSDLFATVLDMVDLPLPADRTIDGVSMLPALQGKAAKRTVPLFWRTHVSQVGDRVALRIGDWKIVGNDVLTEFQLFEIEKDWKEENNLAATMPEKTEEMKRALFEVWKKIESEGPRDWWLTERQKPSRGATLNY